jgi:hypothetical protein
MKKSRTRGMPKIKSFTTLVSKDSQAEAVKVET